MSGKIKSGTVKNKEHRQSSKSAKAKIKRQAARAACLLWLGLGLVWAGLGLGWS